MNEIEALKATINEQKSIILMAAGILNYLNDQHSRDICKYAEEKLGYKRIF